MRYIIYILLAVLFTPTLVPFAALAADSNTIKSVVIIRCITPKGTQYGSGVMISAEGFIITNKHIIANDQETVIYTGCDVGLTESEAIPATFSYKADTLVAAKGVDLALLKIKGGVNFSFTPVYAYNLPSLGTKIQAIGYPAIGGSTITYTQGYVSGLLGSQNDVGNFYIKADINIEAGSSGGGAFTENNELLGITSAVLAGKFNTLGLIIPTVVVRDFLYANTYSSLLKNEETTLGQDIFYDYGKSSPKSNVPQSNIPPDGSIIRPDRNLRTDCPDCPPTVYLIDDGLKRAVNGDTFAFCGFKWENVQTVDANTVLSIPTGTDLSQFEPGVSRGSCYTPKAQRQIRSFPNGTLIQAWFKNWPNFDTNTIYLIENGKKRPFVSREVFEALGYRFNQGETNNWKSNITYATEEEFYQYTMGDFITMQNPPSPNTSQNIPEGAIIRAKGDIDVWIVKYVGNKKLKRLVLSPSVFNGYKHLKWENILNVERSIVDSFTTSDLVRAVDDDKIYKLYPSGDTGQKRWIANSDVFTRLGLDADAVYEINTVDRNSYITGATL